MQRSAIETLIQLDWSWLNYSFSHWFAGIFLLRNIKDHYRRTLFLLQVSPLCSPWLPSTPTWERPSPKFPTSRPSTCTSWAALSSSSWPCWSTRWSTTSSLGGAPSVRRKQLRRRQQPTMKIWGWIPTRCAGDKPAAPRGIWSHSIRLIVLLLACSGWWEM